MVRTHSGPEPPIERRRPTASARAERTTTSRVHQAQQEDEVIVQDPALEEEVPVQIPHEEHVPLSVSSFPGGPEDISVLKSYSEHVAHRLWDGDDRCELKVVTHGRKLARFPCNHIEVETYVMESGLGSLMHCSHLNVDKGLISAFIERWHKDTCTFHLPFGEMTITLDDISSLLHLPTTGGFFTLPILDKAAANSYLVEYLGVDQSTAKYETDGTRGAHVRFNWLEDVYRERLEEGEVENAARAYLLHLVGCTIFADKSSTYVDVAFLELFRNIDNCRRFAWGTVALAFLYDHLSEASRHNVRQCGGYMTLLQAWILEHFPTIGMRILTEGYTEDLPRAQRLTPVRGGGVVFPFRVAIDHLRAEDIIWMPYEDHRIHRPFNDISLFSGFIRCGRMRHPHLPERILRQFGYIQNIPRSPFHVTSVRLSAEEVDAKWSEYADHLVVTGPHVTYPSQCVDGYMMWYQRISHPYVIPPGEGDSARVSMVQPDYTTDDSCSMYGQQVQERFQKISNLLQEMIDGNMVTDGTEASEHVHEALSVAIGGIQFGKTYQRRKKSRSAPSTS